MKRRELKKTINNLSGELLAECMALSCYQGIKGEDVEDIIKSILFMQNEMLNRLSHVEPGNSKIFFKKFRLDIIQQTEEIVDRIKALA